MKEEFLKKLIEIATGKKAKIFWAIVIGVIVLFLILLRPSQLDLQLI